MANYFEVAGKCTAFISAKLSQIGFKNISYVTHDNGIDDDTSKFFIVLKDGSRKELKIVDADE